LKEADMTRRIALAILLTVWATLIAGGIAAYVATRTVLVHELDNSLMNRALSLPQIVDESGRRFGPLTTLEPDDQYIVRNDGGRVVARPAGGSAMSPPREKVSAAFVTLADGTRVRTVTLRAALQPESGRTLEPVTITFRGSALWVDRILDRLAVALIATVVIGGVIAAGVAWLVARGALQPLRSTADVVGSIDERSLNRRIEEKNLPPELLPVASRLNQMLARLEQSLRQRQQFLADASHELRTPVAALLAAMEVALRHPRDAAGYRETIESSLTDARLLQRLVETLLAQVRLGDAGPMYTDVPVDIAAMVNECVTVIRPLANTCSTNVVARGERGVVWVTQPQRVQSILMNLLGNAIEHAGAGVTVIASWRIGNAGLELVVQDNGAGIESQHAAHLFEPFYRVDSSRSSGHLGLGLYLVKTHCEALGGTCRVESEAGEGATFMVTLPASSQATSGETKAKELVRG
jgi:signal transduction histidine kinase